MSRPIALRTASTNLSASGGSRVLEGKLAIVTGGSRGIGAAISTNLASKGASVVLNYTSASSEAKSQELASHLESTYNIRAIAIQADMGSPTGPAHLITSAKNNFSHPKTNKFQIDIIINNAGLAANQTIEETTLETFDSLYSVNVRGPLLLMQAAIPYLPSDRSGRVVNVSSVSSSCGFGRQSIYGGTKAALEAMTRTWSRELSESCTVNAVNPGPVATDMWAGVDDAFLESTSTWVANTPLSKIRDGDDAKLKEQAKILRGRPAYPEEIAGTVAMLCTPDAGWTTGSTVCANGGGVFTN